MIYRPRHFAPHELVDPVCFSKFGADAVAFFRPELLISLDMLRQILGKPFTVNNWKDGGPFKWRGLRTQGCAQGAEYSMHRFGMAIDFDVKGMAAEEVRVWLRAKWADYPDLGNGITRIENGVNWVHVDCRPTNSYTLVEFAP